MPHPWRRPALARWRVSDPRLHALARATPPPTPSLDRLPPFASLVQSISHQQVSLAAGKSIFARIEALGTTPEAHLKAGPDALRAAGLSRPKVAYTLDLAEKAATRTVHLDRLASMPDEEVIESLTSVKGIGVWTAKMFLLFHLERPDVLPYEDLGVQISVSQHYKVSRKLAAKKIQRMGPAWSPWSSYASLVLWNARRVAMGTTPR